MGQKPEGGAHTTPDAYVIDHFSQAGTKASTDFWDGEHPHAVVRSLIHDAGGALFEDSLELETTLGAVDARVHRRLPVAPRLLAAPLLPLAAKNKEKAVFNYTDATTDRLPSGATSTSSSPTSTTRTTSRR